MVNARSLAVALAIACWGVAAPVSAAPIVVNGGFEDCSPASCPGFGGWTVYSSIPGWTAVAGGNFEIQVGTVVTPHGGANYVELDSGRNTSMVQTLTLDPATYTLTFYYQPRTNAQGDNGIAAFFGGVSLLPIADGTNPPQNYWSREDRDFTWAGGPGQLMFSAVGDSNSYGGFIDDVSLVATVPEPATLTLLGLGLVGGATRLRRRSWRS
jgi:hypothetical protein